MARALPHKLELYQLAVQHPPAEAAFLARIYRHYRPGRQATRLKEDFAGGAALAGAWVALHENNRALAVEAHGPTARWAERRTRSDLGARAGDLHILHADVLDVAGPKVDIVAALNFSAFIYHTRAALLAYFGAARRSLRPDGLLVVDAYGGPGAWRVGRQTRRVVPGRNLLPSPQIRRGEGSPPVWFDYIWEQRRCDVIHGRVECHIHFRLPSARRRRWIHSAFRYDWRLWSLPELREVMAEAGFSRAEIWCDGPLPSRRHGGKQSDGIYRPRTRMDAREDWVAYVVGVK